MPIVALIAYLALLVFISGVSSLVYYYLFFGVRIVDLDLGYAHILYRGFSNLFAEPLMLAMLTASVAVNGGYAIVRNRLGQTLRRTAAATTAMVLVMVLVAIWQISIEQGEQSAVQDMYPETTSLRQLTNFQSASPETAERVQDMLNESAPYLVLRRTKDSLLLFRVPRLKAKRPRVSLHYLALAPGDMSTDQVPPERLKQ